MAKRTRDHRAIYARRNELAKQRGYESYPQQLKVEKEQKKLLGLPTSKPLPEVLRKPRIAVEMGAISLGDVATDIGLSIEDLFSGRDPDVEALVAQAPEGSEAFEDMLRDFIEGDLLDGITFEELWAIFEDHFWEWWEQHYGKK